MKSLHALRITLSLAGASALLPASRAAEGAEYLTAVSSTAYKDYKRARLPDGTLQAEYYSFGNGGKWAGPMNDDTIDRLDFMDIARVVAGPLAEQKYFPARDPNSTRLVIMVYWGMTQVADPMQDSEAFVNYQDVRNEINANPLPIQSKTIVVTDATGSLKQAMNSAPSGTDSQMAELANSVTLLNMEQRTHIDYKNAQMLGYDNFDSAGSLVSTDRGKSLGRTALSATYSQEVAEIESPRYFVVLMAYDFQLMWKEKKHKLLWETRFSISQPHNDFTKALPAMANYASRFFGQNSHGLVRDVIREGNVTVGEPTLVESINTPKK
jgi:hypothetical protein